DYYCMIWHNSAWVF
nr:immunoglobulin light chain junction region [Macaca mulatta]MOY05455.1 immunoglobulin light chain junction region [Macaca mulatta]MOY06573.1 immunoglobulin light chain junction region [Macaca mulatta]MOY08966.1 immunoglobulin light chain junction region [Macaca mulatta]MOY09769.1 immunoglobulin light chain junction region [Macaca mulatta]